MGAVHNELRRGALSKAVKNFFGFAATEGGIERFSETAQVVVPAFDLPELNLDRGDKLFGRLLSAAAVAARFNGIQLFNPADSGILAVIELLQSSSLMIGEVSIGDNSAVFANLQTESGVPLDTRSRPAGPSSICVVHMGDAAAATIAAQTVRFSGNPNPGARFVLAPNSQFFALAQTANQALDAGFFWRERKANAEELR